MAHDELEAAADRAALAAILESRGRNQEARETLRNALTTLEAVLGPDHYEVATRLSELGDLHVSVGHFSDAELALTRALTTFERVLGMSHPTTAACRARRDDARSRTTSRGG